MMVIGDDGWVVLVMSTGSERWSWDWTRYLRTRTALLIIASVGWV